MKNEDIKNKAPILGKPAFIVKHSHNSTLKILQQLQQTPEKRQQIIDELKKCINNLKAKEQEHKGDDLASGRIRCAYHLDENLLKDLEKDELIVIDNLVIDKKKVEDELEHPPSETSWLNCTIS